MKVNAIQSVDMDNDGDLDIVATADEFENSLVLYEQIENEGIQPHTIHRVDDGYTKLMLRDLNLDGVVDIVASNSDSNIVHAFFGRITEKKIPKLSCPSHKLEPKVTKLLHSIHIGDGVHLHVAIQSVWKL